MVQMHPRKRSAFREIVLPGLMLFLAAGMSRADQPVSSANTNTWPGADLFADGQVCRVTIEIQARALEELRKEAREFVHAKVEEPGVVYSNVAVHLKGSVGSFRPVDDKPSLTLDFARFSPAQRFHGLRRIHLNNSIEDPSYCNEQLGSELFRTAGIPAPRVSRAVVTLNGRPLGLYLLKEAFTEDFLGCYFPHVTGDLFEPGEGHDVNEHLKRVSLPGPAHGRAVLKALSQAALDQDPGRGWGRLQAVLDVDRFIRFMVLEIMLCHRDGYCLARNNFKAYQDFDAKKMVFLPQGMDQLFHPAELPWQPQMAGLVARAVFAAPEGKARYVQEFKTLFATLFHPELLSNRVAQIIGPLHEYAEPAEFKRVQAEAAALEQRILLRHHWLAGQLSQPTPQPLQFRDGTAPLTGWTATDAPTDGQMDQVTDSKGVRCLHLRIHSDGFPSWRAKAHLAPGRYRFEARVRVSDVRPLNFGTHRGAGLRIAGQDRQSDDLVGTSSWRALSSECDVGVGRPEVEFICELRASSGEAWFDSDSTRVVQVK
jgi:CotH protein